MKMHQGIVAGVCALVASTASFANPPHGNRCRAVHAVIVDTRTTENCASPYNFCAAGTIEGNRGLNGTTFFVLDGVSPPPVTAPGFSTTTGLLVYTTPDGTLTVRETGVSKLTGNPSNGILTSVQEIVSGTGKFTGATGVLWNNATDVNGVFYSNIVGELCLVRRAE